MRNAQVWSRPDAVGGSVMGFISFFIGRCANPLIFVAYCDGTGPLWDTLCSFASLDLGNFDL
jgi:hypothetical protein